MVDVPESYRLREQSYIKHAFLTDYLREAAYKTLQGRSKTFNFVDAFAGPWQVSDEEDFSDASFDQAVRTLEAVRADLELRGLSGLKIRFYFCEQRREAVQRLREYAAKRASIEIRVFEGKFEENLDKIAADIPDGFTFTFIDPTGWDISNIEVFRFLKGQNGEFLLNFMSDHINRHAEYDKVIASFGRFLADPEWKVDFEKLPSDWSNESCVLHLMRQKMKRAGVAKYLPDFSILVPRSQRIKMRLVLGTSSTSGLTVFRDVHARIEKKEIEVRNALRDKSTDQIHLFSAEEIAEIQQKSSGVGGSIVQRQIEQYLRERLRNGAIVSFENLWIDVLDRFPIRLTQLKDLLGKLKQSSVIKFDIPAGKKKIQESSLISLL